MYSDKELVEGIRNRDNEVLEYIYDEYYPSIQYLVNGNHGSDEEARDVFQDILLIVFSKIQDQNFNLHCSLKTYIFAIGRNLWLKKLSLNRRWKALSLKDQEILIDAEFDQLEVVSIDELKRLLYQKYFLELSTICQKILEMMAKKYSYKDITQKLKLRNEQYARKKKYRCIQSLIKRVHRDPGYKIFLKDEIQV
jgi:RNA polymerase sigma factor (sigma-70 family)